MLSNRIVWQRFLRSFPTQLTRRPGRKRKQSRGGTRVAASSVIEPLETRVLLSAAATITDAALQQDELNGHPEPPGDGTPPAEFDGAQSGSFAIADLATFTVNSVGDTVDANPGDGLALDAAGNTTLRAAIMESNALAGPDTILLPAGTYVLALAGTGEDAAAAGDLDVTGELTVVGAGSGSTIIDANGIDRAIDVQINGELHISAVQITNGFLSGNVSGGGGIRNSGTLHASDAVVTGNSAHAGGGILNRIGSTTLANLTISLNTANFGGGVANDQGTLELVDSTLSENSAAFNGGGVVNAFGTATITNGTFSNNTADSGGAVASDGTLFVAGTAMSGNSATSGGGLSITGGMAELTNVSLLTNSASFVGGAISNSADLEITGGSLQNNSADMRGGAIVNSGDLGLFDSLLEGNVATGGGTTVRGDGGGIYNASGGTVTASDGRLINNRANLRGGAIANLGSAMLTNLTISENSATLMQGGGIDNDGTLTLDRSLISGNISRTEGGGIRNRGTLTVSNSTISGNQTASAGGGIYNGATATLHHSTVTNNSADLGGGLWNSFATVHVAHTIVAGNSAATLGPDVGVNSPVTSEGFNLIGNASGSSGWIGSDDLNRDPLLAALGDNGGPTLTHALLEGSPAIDAGDNTGAPTVDQRGLARIVDGDGDGTPTIDIGAYEFLSPIGATGSGLFADSGQQLGSLALEFGALGDLDGDGDLDAFLARSGGNRVWLNDGNGAFTDTEQSLGSSSSRAVALEDLDGDGDLDAFVNNFEADKVWLNLGDGSFVDSGQALGTGSSVVGLADLDGDGDRDAVTGTSSEVLRVWLNNGNGQFSSGQVVSQSGSHTRTLVVGDMDGDGDADVVTGGSTNGGVSVANRLWLNDGSGTFAPGQYFSHVAITSLAADDLDDDGDLDVFAGTFNAWNQIWLNDGAGNFANTAQTVESSNPRRTLSTDSVAAGDLDADGDVDAVIAGDDGAVRVWWNDGFGYYSDSKQGLRKSSNRQIQLGDVNNDGSLDAVVFGGAQAEIWLNLTGAGDAVVPLATIEGVSPNPRTTPVEELTFVFSEPVLGFDLSDLRLTRNGGENLLTGAETLQTVDNVTWTLGRLSQSTIDSGNYQLTLNAADSQIGDAAGNGMASDVAVAWTTEPGTVFVVTNTNDSGAGSLRQAMLDANGAPGRDTIQFSIPGAGPHSLSLLSALPSVTDPVIIDGTTEPDYVPATGLPVIELDGRTAGDAVGLHIEAGFSVVRGLAINRFALDGIYLETNGHNFIEGNHIGTDTSGTLDLGNTRHGILIEAPDNRIQGNLVSGNGLNGISIPYRGGDIGTRNVIQGNRIGTDVAGQVDLGNGGDGILFGTRENVIGGAHPNAGNLISGNDGNGIEVQFGTANANENVIQGNFIGTNAAGSGPVGNDGNGILLTVTGRNVIGGAGAGLGNLISGNGASGIYLGWSSHSNVIQGNLIGTDIAGDSGIPNDASGIGSANALDNNIIGGTRPGTGNLVSGNQGAGIFIGGQSTFSKGNVIYGNLIGTDQSGLSGLGNASHGIVVTVAEETVIGSWLPGAGNVISANGISGIFLGTFGTDHNTVQGNRIGTDRTGTQPLGNLGHGVHIKASPDNLVGGTTPAAGNTIAFNGGDGIFAESGTANRFSGNSISSNIGLGIDLGTDGVTPNDAGDADAGSNNLQNFPILTSAALSGGTIRIAGSVRSAAGASLTLEFFSSAAADPTGFGEGRTYLGSTTVTTDGDGNADFTFDLAAAVPTGHAVTATATDAGGNTSEFSPAVIVTEGDSTPPTVTSIERLTPAGEFTNAAQVVYRVTFSEQVNNVGLADFTLLDLAGTITGESVAAVSAASGTVIDVTVATGSAGDGDLRLDVLTTAATISDGAGNALNADFTAGELYRVDRTGPAVTLTAPATTGDTTPSVTVSASDANGLSDGTAVALDVDRNNDGDFGDSSELDHTTAVLTSGSATFDVNPALPLGTYRLRARVTDRAGNAGESFIATMEIGSLSGGSLSLVESTFYGGSGDQWGTGIEAFGSDLFVTGNAGSQGLLLNYDAGSTSPAWNTLLDSQSGLEGLSVSSAGLFAVGSAIPPTYSASDNVGGTEGKSLLTRFTTGGSFTSASSENFFTYRGGETYSDSVTVGTDASGGIYVIGRGEETGFGGNRTILAKYSADGSLLWKRKYGTGPDGNSVAGTSTRVSSFGYGITWFNGYLYAAGSDQDDQRSTAGPDAGPRAMLLKYDAAGQPMDANPDADGAQVLVPEWSRIATTKSEFRDVAAVDGFLYAVGYSLTASNGADYLIEKYDEAGNRLWRMETGSAGADILTGVVGAGGRLYAVGYTTSEGAGMEDIVVLEIDPASGNILDRQLFGGSDRDLAAEAALVGNSLYVVGDSRSFAGGGNAAGERDLVLLQYQMTAAPPIPELLSPTGLTEDATPTFTWTDVGADRYDMWVYNQTTNTHGVIREENLSAPSFTPDAPLPAGVYRFWVRAFNAAGETNGWSDALSFTIGIVPEIPALTGPTGLTGDTTPTFTWTDVGAARYDLWVYNQTTNTHQVIRQENLTANSFTPSTPLADGTYTFWVRAFNATGATNGWSTGLEFSVGNAPAIPMVTSPTGITGDTTPTFTWTDVGAARYDLWVYNQTTDTHQVIREEHLATNSFTPAAALSTGSYTFWVQAFSSSGLTNGWSAAGHFTIGSVPDVPTLLAPAGTTSDFTPTFTWTDVGAAHYDLWVYNVTTNTHQVIRQQNLTGASYTPSAPLAAGHYRFWVQAFNAAGQTQGWSAGQDFRIPEVATLAASFIEDDADGLDGTARKSALEDLAESPAASDEDEGFAAAAVDAVMAAWPESEI